MVGLGLDQTANYQSFLKMQITHKRIVLLTFPTWQVVREGASPD